jgi:hypothetical protein
MAKNIFPPGWDEKRVKELIAYYDQQTDEEVAAEIEVAFDQEADETELASVDTYYKVINEGIQGLSPTKLAEIAEFVYFLRKRYLQPEDDRDELRQALLRVELNKPVAKE